MSFTANQITELVGILFKEISSSDLVAIAQNDLALPFVPEDAQKWTHQVFVDRVVRKAEEVGRDNDLLIAILAEKATNAPLRDFADKVLVGALPVLPGLIPILKRYRKAINAEAESAYADSISRGWLERVPAGSAETLAINLAFTLARGSTGELLRYARVLAARLAGTEPKAAQQLEDWARGAAPVLGLALPALPPPRVKGEPSLMIKVAPATQSESGTRGEGSTRYLVWGWYCDGGGQFDPLGPAQEVDEDGLKSSVQAFREALQNLKGKEPTDLLLEVFLPRELLNSDLDSWTIKATPQRIDTAVGLAHPVVIRSTERAHPSYDRTRLQTRWSARSAAALGYYSIRVPKLPPTVTSVAVAVEDLGLPPDEMLVLLTSGWVERTVCSLLDRPPRTGPKKKPKRGSASATASDTIDVLLAAGYPVIVWDRDEKADVPKVHELVSGKALEMLPDEVFESRKEAKRLAILARLPGGARLPKRSPRGAQPSPWSLGRSISILFDRPDRIPPHFDDSSQPGG